MYILIVAGGALGLGLLVPFLFYRLRKPSWKQPETSRRGEPVMSTVHGDARPAGSGRTLYIVVAVVVVVLMVVGLFTFRSAKSTQQAEEKAAQLITALENAGARAPSKEQVVRVLGDDGGAVCDDPNGALSRATLLAQLTNGASGPGIRPVIADSRVVQGRAAGHQDLLPRRAEELPDVREQPQPRHDVAAGEP